MLADQILDAKGREVATIHPQASVGEAVQLLAQHNVGALVVSEDGAAVIGILSERDVVRRLAGDGAAVLEHRVEDLMAREVATCHGHADLEVIMNTMTSGRFRHMPVVDDGHLRGIVSIGDVVKARIDELATEAEQLVDYIRTGR